MCTKINNVDVGQADALLVCYLCWQKFYLEANSYVTFHKSS